MSTHQHSTVPSDPELRVKALESLLVEKGLVDPKTLDELVDLYETKIGPRNGAKVVAKAWKDPEFKKYLLEKPTDAIASLGYRGRQGEHMRVVENTRRTSTTSSSVPFVPAIPGRFSGFLRSGTNPHLTAPGWSVIPVRYWRNSEPNWQKMWKSVSGIQHLKCGTLSFRKPLLISRTNPWMNWNRW